MNPAEIAHGPMFIGFMFNVFLFGIMVTQVYIYYTAYKKDRLGLKLFVLILFIADIFNTVFIAIYLYKSLISKYGETRFLETADWTFATDPALTAFIASLVQGFFAWRVTILSKNKWLGGAILACAAAGGVGGFLTAVKVMETPKFVDFQKFQSVVSLWLAAECAGDILITTSLVWHLKKNKTGFKQSDEVIEKIIRLTVQTGLLTAICAATDLITFLTDPTGIHLIFNFPLAKLYTNTLMSSLNSRGNWNTTVAAPQANVLGSHSSQRAAFNPEISKASVAGDPPHKQFGNPQQVFIHVESHRLHDMAVNRNTAELGAADRKAPSTRDLKSEWEDPVAQKRSAYAV